VVYYKVVIFSERLMPPKNR